MNHNTVTITADRDTNPETAAAIVAGLQGMAAKEMAYEQYMAACAAYQVAEDAANVADASPEVRAAWRAADEHAQAMCRTWMAL